MGLQIQTGGGAGSFGSGFGAGVAGETQNQLAQQREQETEARHQAEKQAIADEMVGAISQDFVSRADTVRESIPPGGSDLSPGQAGPLADWQSPGPNPDMEGHDEWVAQHVQALQGMKSPEAAELYAQSLSREMDGVLRAQAGKRLSSSMEAAVSSGAATDAETQPFLEQLLAPGADLAKVYSEWNDFRSDKIKSQNRTKRGMRRIEQMREEASVFDSSGKAMGGERSAWMDQQSRRINALADRIETDMMWGDDDLDYDAVEKEFNSIMSEMDPMQKRRWDAEAAEQRQADRMELEVLQSRNSAIIKAVGERLDGDEMNSLLESIGGSPPDAPNVDDPGVTGDPLGDLAKGVNSGALSGDAARAGLTDALEAMGWEPGTSVKDWVLGQPPEIQGKIKWLHERMSAEVADPLQSAALQPHPEAPTDGSKPLTQWVH